MNNLRILLVEDESSMEEIFTRLLERLVAAFPGATISRVEELKEALDIVRGLAPDVTVLDLNLKDATAETTIEEIGSIVQRSPVVVVTGMYDARLRVKAMRYGAHAFLTKLELAERPSLLEKMVISAMASFKAKQYEGLASQIEALRKFALQDGPET